MSNDNNPLRWYLYNRKENGGLFTSLDTPETLNANNEYNVWGPFRNSEIVDKWIEKRKDLVKDGTK